ncbi:MAG: MBL fold metallo-hydrolase [Phycisphaerales bacterium]
MSKASPDIRVISIGALAAHPLWGERAPARTGHATTTLIRSGGATILVDPGLPEGMLTARLAERANLRPEEITHVFLTSFRPDTSRGIGAFERATWWVTRAEREAVGVQMVALLKRAMDDGEEKLRSVLERDVGVLRRCVEVPEVLAPGVDLFPLPGFSPGLSGLLLEHAESTTVVCGDAVATFVHLREGQVVPGCADFVAARGSFAEAVEIADWLVLGRDNIMPSPGRVREE